MPASSDPCRKLPAFQQAVVEWFQAEGRDYPWRRTQDPYAVLVSEMMLQQTQVATVLGRRYFENWMEKFPTVEILAQAGESELLRAWEGLGYYRRARNLQRAAQVVAKEHGGVFPAAVADLEKLPGLGRYTAGAVATFASGAPVPIVDANIARVLARLFNFREEIDSTPGQAFLWKTAASLVPKTQARDYNSGLMEIGQRICTARHPNCGACPVQAHCAGHQHQPELLPLKRPPRSTVHLEEHVAWTVRDGALLMHQETGKRRQGLWKLPERTAEMFLRHGAASLFSLTYTITHHRVKLHVYEAPWLIQNSSESWQSLRSLASLPMPAPYRKIIDNIKFKK